MSLRQAVAALRNAGADRVLLKQLAPNDNSKNQVYVGGGEPALRELRVDLSSAALTGEGNKTALRVEQPAQWMDDQGRSAAAPTTKVIFYPQYPEARMSGFAKGVPQGFGGRDLLVARAEGRTLLIGLTTEGWLLWVGTPETDELEGLQCRELPQSPFVEVLPDGADSPEAIWRDLLDQISNLAAGPPLDSVRLTPDGTLQPTNPRAPHAGGYALEAALGIPANAVPGPDFRGLVELKTFSKGRISLMTPEPTGGIYADEGGKVEFLQRWGTPCQGRRKLCFNGQHRLNERKTSNPLTLRVEGWSEERPGIYEPDGALHLRDEDGTSAASWLLKDMNGKWMRKHPEALYVQMERERDSFRLTGKVSVCHGTDFRLFMLGLRAGSVIFDPGHSMPLATQKVHPRSQWRTTTALILGLYDEVEHLDLI